MATDVNELAQDIFVGMAVSAGPDNWEWDEMAQSAINAAGRFVVIQQQQSAPAPTDSTATSTSAAASPAPDPTATPAPSTPDPTATPAPPDPTATPAAAGSLPHLGG
jgi:hypothetical protein